MKKSLKSIVSKFSLTAFALILLQSLSFASAKEPDVYISRSSLSDLSGAQLLETGWFWLLIAFVILVLVAAYFAANITGKTDEPHAS